MHRLHSTPTLTSAIRLRSAPSEQKYIADFKLSEQCESSELGEAVVGPVF